MVETRSWVPATSSTVIRTSSPVRHSTGPAANRPRRIFGPLQVGEDADGASLRVGRVPDHVVDLLVVVAAAMAEVQPRDVHTRPARAPGCDPASRWPVRWCRRSLCVGSQFEHSAALERSNDHVGNAYRRACSVGPTWSSSHSTSGRTTRHVATTRSSARRLVQHVVGRPAAVAVKALAADQVQPRVVGVDAARARLELLRPAIVTPSASTAAMRFTRSSPRRSSSTAVRNRATWSGAIM